jgi:hypothetical protein
MYSKIVIICVTIVILMVSSGCSIKKATEFNYIEEKE